MGFIDSIGSAFGLGSSSSKSSSSSNSVDLTALLNNAITSTGNVLSNIYGKNQRIVGLNSFPTSGNQRQFGYPEYDPPYSGQGSTLGQSGAAQLSTQTILLIAGGLIFAAILLRKL